MQTQTLLMLMEMSWTRPGAMKITFVTPLNTRIPGIPKDPVQANPLKGWNNAYHGIRKPGINYSGDVRVIDEGARVSNSRKQPQHQVVDGYASHREYPILKPPHTTNQALTRVRDRVQDRTQYESVDPNQEEYGQTGWLTYMRDIAFPTSPWRLVSYGMARVPPYFVEMDMRSDDTTSDTDRISRTGRGVMSTLHPEHEVRRVYTQPRYSPRSTINILGQQTSPWPRRAKLRRN